jgi:predicted Zn-dependent peptidase
MRHRQTFLAAALAATVAAGALAQQIPTRPEQLTYPGLTYTVPDAKALKATLANGVTVYLAEDRLLPLVNVQVYFRGGRYMEPAGKEGVAGLTGTVWRTGGAGALDSKQLDEELDFLAAQLATNVGDVTGSVTLNLLSKDLDRGLALLMDVLRAPRFEDARLAKAKEDTLAAMKRRNDDAEDIESREWNRLVYGEDYWINRLATKASVDAITRADLAAFHKRLAVPANLVVAVSGDFKRAEMLVKLGATLGSWKEKGVASPAVPQPAGSAKPGVYLVDKTDVNQGRVSIGHLGGKRPMADEAALMVANDIYGGGGFTAWMMLRIRSDEGLAYSAYSNYEVGDLIPGEFRAYFQSKSATCARAAQLTLDLMKKIRGEAVSAKELDTSKSSFIETFPRTFETKARTVSRFALDDLMGRPHEYWTGYRDRMKAVTADSVRAAAAAHYDPAKLIVLVVGPVDEVLKGHPDHPGAKLEAFGSFTRLPLRDPMTLAPLK